MDLKRIFLVAAGLAVAIALAVLLLRRADTPDARLRRTLQEIADYASRRDVSAIVEHVSPSFTSPRGQVDRPGLKRLLLGVLLREGWSKVWLLEPALEPQEDGSFEVDVVVIGAQGSDLPEDVKLLAPQRARAFRITGRFVDEDGTFRCVEADWADARASDLLPTP